MKILIFVQYYLMILMVGPSRSNRTPILLKTGCLSLKTEKSVNIVCWIFEPGHCNLCVFLKTWESGFWRIQTLLYPGFPPYRTGLYVHFSHIFIHSADTELYLETTIPHPHLGVIFSNYSSMIWTVGNTSARPQLKPSFFHIYCLKFGPLENAGSAPPPPTLE